MVGYFFDSYAIIELIRGNENYNFIKEEILRTKANPSDRLAKKARVKAILIVTEVEKGVRNILTMYNKYKTDMDGGHDPYFMDLFEDCYMTFRDINNSLNNLKTDNQKECIVEHFIKGKSQTDIAKEQNKSQGQISKIINAAINHITNDLFELRKERIFPNECKKKP